MFSAALVFFNGLALKLPRSVLALLLFRWDESRDAWFGMCGGYPACSCEHRHAHALTRARMHTRTHAPAHRARTHTHAHTPARTPKNGVFYVLKR